MIRTLLLLSVVLAALADDVAPQLRGLREVAGLHRRVSRQTSDMPMPMPQPPPFMDPSSGGPMGMIKKPMDMMMNGMTEIASTFTSGMGSVNPMGSMRRRRAARMKSVGQAPQQPPPAGPPPAPEPPSGPPSSPQAR